MRQAIARQRSREGSRTAKWLIAGGVVLAMMGVTFGLGVLVGHHLPRHGEPVQAAADAGKRSGVASRRSGLTEPPERPAIQEKLTFYQTLTAPLDALPTAAKVDATAKPEAAKRAGTEPPPGPAAERPAGAPPAAPNAEKPPQPPRAQPTSTGITGGAEKSASAQSPRPAQVGPVSQGGDWTVQVGAFKERGQAESVRKPLVAAGLSAYLAMVPADGGQVRYKVRVGSFKTREEAVRMAERMRQERSLTAFVTR